MNDDSLDLVWVHQYGNVGPGKALGTSIRNGMMVLATIDGKQLRNIEYYVQENGYPLRGCPHAEEFKGWMISMDTEFAKGPDSTLKYLVGKAFRESEFVGHDMSDIKLHSETGGPFENVFDIPASHPMMREMFLPGGPLANTKFLSNLKLSGDVWNARRARMTEYYWNSLRTDADGNKCFDNPTDRPDAMLAVARAFAALKLKDAAHA
jgi:hypothetical protein